MPEKDKNAPIVFSCSPNEAQTMLCELCDFTTFHLMLTYVVSTGGLHVCNEFHSLFFFLNNLAVFVMEENHYW